MAETLGDRIHLNSPVRSVEDNGKGVLVKTENNIYEADYVIIGQKFLLDVHPQLLI